MEYKFSPVGSIVDNPKYFPKQTTTATITDRMSMFGTPVLSNLEIPAGKYKTLDGKIVNFEGIRIDAVLFNVTQSKNIVKTAIQGRNGTIKEYVSDGDFEISAVGVIVGESIESGTNFKMIQSDGIYPENDVRKLVEICKIPTEIKIVSDFLDFFEIRNVVIESFAFGQIPGDNSGQPFELSMISETPIELINI